MSVFSLRKFSQLNVGTLQPPGGVPTGLSDLTRTLQMIFSTLYAVAGVAAFIFMIIGGYDMIISSGDPQKLEKGQKTFMYALIGMVIIVSSGLIFNWIGRATGIGNVISTFNLPFM